MDFAGNETALAGVTNLITKDRVTMPMTSFTIGYGSWNTIYGRFYHEGSSGDFHYLFGGTYEQSDYTNYGTRTSWLNMINDPEYKKGKIYFKTSLFLNPEAKVSLFAHHTQHVGDVGRPNREYNHQYDLINFLYENKMTEDINLYFKAGYRYYNRRWEEDNYNLNPPSLSLRSKDGVKQNIFPFDLSLNYRHWSKSILTIGTDLQIGTYKTYSEVGGNRNYGNDASSLNYGFYIQEKVILDKWVFRFGGRYNYTKHKYDLIGSSVPEIKKKSWNRILWTAGIRYNASEKIGIYANAGSSFLVPSAKSIGGTLKSSDRGVPGRDGQLPNPGLKPEKGYGFDLGIDLSPSKEFQIGLRGFFNIVDDAIVENRISETPSQTQSVNAGKAKAYGIEAEVNHYHSDWLIWFVNGTFSKTKVKNPIDSDQDGSNIPFVPKFIANVGATLKLPYEFQVSPYFQYVGTYYDSSSKRDRKEFGEYATLNMNIKKSLYKTSSYTANLIVDLNNIFDKKYEMPWQFQDPGFNAMAKIELRF